MKKDTIRLGCLVKIGPFVPTMPGNKYKVVRIFKKLQDRSFLNFGFIRFEFHEDELITAVVDMSQEKSMTPLHTTSGSLFKPFPQYVQIIYDAKPWWINSWEITEIIT